MVIVHSISCPIAYVIAFLASTEYWQLILVPSTIVVASTSLCFHGGLHLIAIDDLGKDCAHGFCRGRKTCATSLSTPNPKLRDHSSG